MAPKDLALWDWMTAAYGRPGVSERCLALQDQHGQSVSYLLWAYRARPADPELIARAADASRRWDAAAIAPLRAARRAMKPACPPVPEPAREALRETVKAAELQAERVLVDTLEAMSGAAPGAASGLAALTAASQAWGAPAPKDALASLAAALE